MMVRLRVTQRADGSFAVAPPEAIAIYVDRPSYAIVPVEFGLHHAEVVRLVGAGPLTESLRRTSSVVGHYLVAG
jgi:hypothetical protein